MTKVDARPLHIAMYVAAWPLGANSTGILTYADALRSELSKQGHRLSILTGKLDPTSTESGVYSIKPTRRFRVVSWLRELIDKDYPIVFGFGNVVAHHMRRLHESDPIDVIEIEESFGFAGDVAKALAVPVVVKLHGPEFLNPVEEARESKYGRERIRLEGAALEHVAAVIAPARCTLSQTIDYYGLRPTLSEHVVNPIAPEAGEPLWSLEACDRQTILFVGRFDKRKGADTMLQAFKALLVTHPDARLLVVGPDNGLPLEDGRLARFDEYRDLMFSPSQAQLIEFRGRMTPSEINVLRTRALVTVVAAPWENQSYATLEAMLQGCPVVCVDGGGQGELVTHRVSGLLARKGDVSSLCEQLAYMLDHPEEGRGFGERARQYVLQNHHPSAVADQTLAVYRRAITQFNAARAG
jgi:glycosyltransferase involved in cell wall biosynthesis